MSVRGTCIQYGWGSTPRRTTRELLVFQAKLFFVNITSQNVHTHIWVFPDLLREVNYNNKRIMGKNLLIIPPFKEAGSVDEFKKRNGYQALLLAFLSLVMLALHVTMLARHDSWIKMKGGLTQFPGNFPSGQDILLGVYPDVQVCYTVSDSLVNVSGFVWVPLEYSDTLVTCEFKRIDTPLELQKKVNRTSVVKIDSDGACGLFRCENTPVSDTANIFNCESRLKLVSALQVVAVVACLFMGAHFIYFVFLRTNSYGPKIGRLFTMLPKTLCLQVFFLVLTLLLMCAGYTVEQCGKRLSRLSTIQYATYFTAANILLTYGCYAVARSAYLFTPLKIVNTLVVPSRP